MQYSFVCFSIKQEYSKPHHRYRREYSFPPVPDLPYEYAESGNIYLRNRYYNSATGRFITEDPAQDGLNWYVYAGNNPVSFVDPWGLYRLEFDNDGRVYAVIDLSAGDTLYNIAQAEVGDGNAWVNMGYQYDPGYLFDGEWVDITGIYNDAYPNPNPNKPYIGPEDYAAGVRLAYTNGNFYYDVSIPVNNALDRDRGLFEQNGNDLSWFSTMVGDNGVWNLKYYDSVTGYSSWENTIGVTFPGYGPLMLFGEIVNGIVKNRAV